MNKIFAAIGVSDFKSYMQKYFLPIFLIDFIVLFLFLFGFDNVFLKWGGLLIFLIVLIILFTYPILLIDKQSKDIEHNLHFFITYAGALSTVNLERKDMFEDLASKIRYKEIAKSFRKLLYLVGTIKLDFSTAAYKIASLYQTEHFARFLERMGIALSFNSNVADFFMEEQKALMNSYAIIYKESLERIKLLEEMFVSLILAFSFVLSTILLMPFLTGINSTIFLLMGIFGIFILDLIIIVFAKYFIPEDKLYHNLGFEKTRQNVVITFIISILMCMILFPFIFFTNMSLLLKIGIILSPLFITGIYSNYQEKLVWQRNVLFPPFIRSLGDIHQSKGGTLTTTVETLMPHNFGILNDMLERVYKRLVITKDKFNSWYHFSKESGSSLIAEFMDIFVTVVYRGGSAQVAGAIVSDNMSRINGLRDIKREYVSSLKGDVYGVFFGFALTIYISLLISSLLFNIFTSMTSGIDGMALEMIDGIFPTDLDNNLDISLNYVAFIIIIHAFLSSIFLKSVDGGNYFSALQDFILLLWMGIILEIILTLLFENMFASYFI